MLIIKTIPEITVPVDVQVPGEAELSRIQATWKLHGFDEANARVKAIHAGEIDDQQLVAEDLLGLADVKDEQGKDLAFTPELVVQLMQMTYVRQPLIGSWFAAQSCRAEAAAKN